MIVLDTDILTFVQRGQGEEYHRIRSRLRERPGEVVCTTIISLEEQMRGWLAYIAGTASPDGWVTAYAKLRALQDDYRPRPLLDFDDRAALEFRRLRDRKIRIGTMDLKIAAIVSANRALLVSRNLRDFRRVPGLLVEDWTIA
jgi:tRNA(fMet)-specific endonuclease VapC